MPPKKRPPLTHFLCLPLTNGQAAAQWRASLHSFTDHIAADSNSGVSAPTSTSISVPNPTSTSVPASTSASTATSTSTSILGSTEGKSMRGGIPVKAIRPLGTLHLTIGVMSLQEEGRLEEAIECLRKLDLPAFLAPTNQLSKPEKADPSSDPAPPPVLSPSSQLNRNASPTPPPLTLSFTGLKSMHSPKLTSFLYARPTDNTGRLYPFCERLRDRFTAEGLITEEERGLKLHATVLNTIYAGKVSPTRKLVQGQDGRFGVAKRDGGEEEENKEDGKADEDREQDQADEENVGGEGSKNIPSKQKGKGKSKSKKQVVKFDARELIKRYEDYGWAEDVRIEKVAICEMGAKKVIDENGEVVGEEYTEIASVALP